MRFGPDGRRQDSDWQQLLVDNQRGEIRFNVELEKPIPKPVVIGWKLDFGR